MSPLRSSTPCAARHASSCAGVDHLSRARASRRPGGGEGRGGRRGRRSSRSAPTSRCCAPFAVVNSSAPKSLYILPSANTCESASMCVMLWDASTSTSSLAAESGRRAERLVPVVVGVAREAQPLWRAPVVEDGHALTLDREGEAVHLAGPTHPRRRQDRLRREQVQRAPFVVGAPPAPVARHVDLHPRRVPAR